VRFDGTIDETQRKKMAASLPPGASLKLAQSHAGSRRTYGLIEGPDSLEPAEAEASFPQAHWYDGTIIALAIEPTPADALPAIEGALGGDGKPAGVLECSIAAGTAIVEFRPESTPPALILDLADVELRRFHGYRKVSLLNPLPTPVVAQIASAGLQAPEITPGRILETLLEQSGVE